MVGAGKAAQKRNSPFDPVRNAKIELFCQKCFRRSAISDIENSVSETRNLGMRRHEGLGRLHPEKEFEHSAAVGFLAAERLDNGEIAALLRADRDGGKIERC